MRNINKLDAYITIARSGGTIFTACFVKKDNTTRVINCRTEVKKDLTGKGLKFDPLEKKLVSVYDLKKKSYRFINLDTIKYIKINKETLIVK